MTAPLNESPQLAAQAYKIADEMSMCDIESNSVPVRGVGRMWWDTDPERGAEEGMQESLSYLDGRGLLIRRPDDPLVVRFNRGRA